MVHGPRGWGRGGGPNTTVSKIRNVSICLSGFVVILGFPTTCCSSMPHRAQLPTPARGFHAGRADEGRGDARLGIGSSVSRASFMIGCVWRQRRLARRRAQHTWFGCVWPRPRPSRSMLI